jgi:hypothetical protein
MLAPTRELVAELNQRARTHRLTDSPPDTEVTLADGNWASIGELIITRSNDRQLRMTSSSMANLTVALGERRPGRSDCEGPREDTPDHRPSPWLIAG